MRRLITITCTTLDGVLQAPGGPDEDPTGSFAHGGWSFPFWDESVDRINDDLADEPFDLLLGRKTYDFFAAFWPDHEHVGNGKAMNAATKYVASRGAPRLNWDRSEQLGPDLVASVRAIKEQDGPDIQVHGSGDLLQTLLGSGLIDQLRVLTFPVTVGEGKRLFGLGSVPMEYTVERTSVSDRGVIAAVYAPVGPLRTGTFGSDG